MKEQKNSQPIGNVELELLTPEQLADHAMAAAAAEAEIAAQAEGEAAATPGARTATPSGKTATSGAAAESVQAPVHEASASGSPAAPRKKKKKKKKKAAAPAADEHKQPKTFLDVMHDFINTDEDQPLNINFRGLVGGEGLPGFFRKNWVFISVIVLFTCAYVTCRYMMQSAVIEHDKLTEQLIDRRYKNLTLDCELLERTLSSQVEKELKDSTIHTPTEQSFTLKTEAPDEDE